MEVSMKNSWKAALISAIIFPGLGQIWLKRYLRGLILITATVVFSAAIIMKGAQEVFNLLNRIEAEGGNVDMVAIMRSATAASAAGADTGMTMAAYAVIVCWVVAVVDAFRLGRQKDRALRQAGESSQQGDGKREE
jgi:hypothetical protein